MIVNSGKWSCGVCGNGVQTLFSAQYVLDSQEVQWGAWLVVARSWWFQV